MSYIHSHIWALKSKSINIVHASKNMEMSKTWHNSTTQKSKVKTLLNFLIMLMHATGETFLYWFGPDPRICITDPELAKQVLSNKFCFFPEVTLPSIQALMGRGLPLIQGAEWARHRHVVSPAFTVDKLKVSCLWTFHILQQCYNLGTISSFNRTGYHDNTYKRMQVYIDERAHRKTAIHASIVHTYVRIYTNIDTDMV